MTTETNDLLAAMTDDYISGAEAASILGVSRQRVSQLVESGDLPAVRPWPRAIRIPRAAVEAWANQPVRRRGPAKTNDN
jgi:excisionase family DNA binding protein